MSLEFTLVRRAISLAVIDGPDAGDNPDILKAQGSVLFEPVIKKGDSIQVQTRGGSETYALAPIECPINDGIISHRGQDGVKLPAGGEAANPSLIRWKATFSRMQAGGKSFTLAPVIFDAVPGGEIDLTMVAPVAGAPEGVVRGPRGTSLESIIVDGSELVFTAVDDAGSFEIARIPLDEMVRAEAEAAADGVRDALAVDVAASQSARDAAEGHANRAATSESNAATSEANAKQSETNAGDYAAVATTAATEAVDAMERATDIAGGDFATHEYVDDALVLKADKAYVDSAVWLKSALDTGANVDTLPSGIYPVPTSTVATTLGLPLGEPGELETTWLDSSGLRRRQTFHVDPYLGARPGYAMYRRWYYNGTWQPWVRYDDAWHKGRLSSSDNISNLAQGAYEVPTSAVAKSLGLPAEEMGTLTIYHIGSGIYRRAVFDIDPVSGYRQFRARYYNGTWYDWKLEVTSSTPFFRGPIPDGVQPDTMMGNAWNGEWTLLSGNGSAWGLPSNAASVLYVSSSGTSTLQEITTFTTPIQKYQRRAYNGAWSGPWEPMVGGGSSQPVETVGVNEYAESTTKNALNSLVPAHVDPTGTYVVDHANLVADLKSRLGTVSTGGKAAVALVADHGTTAFKDWLWAEAKSRNIPFTMALAPEVHLDGKGDSRHTATNADIKQWISEGLVIASHSGDHSGALGYFDISRQIKTSKAKLEEKLETKVDCWVQPGYTLATGNFDGFGTGQSVERYTDYYAGRMLQQTYPVVTGYAGNDYVYAGDADLPVGVRRSLTERKDGYQTVVDYIEQAISTGGKHINFCHPYALPDSSSTYVTKSEYIAYLDWLAQKRDAGDLVLLTLPQLMVARP